MPNQASIDAVTSLNFTGVIMLSVDSYGRLLGINPYGCALVGRPEHELRGAPWYELFVAEPDRKLARSLCTRFISGDWLHTQVFESSMVPASGRTRRIAWRPARMIIKSGEPEIYFCLGEDISDRQRAQTDLAESELKMAAVVENAVEGIITITERGIMQTANKAASRIFGYTREEMIGNNVSMLMPSPDREQHDGYLQRYVETGIAGIIGKGREVIALRKNGERFPIYLSVSDIRGEARLFMGLVRDLSEEKRMQRELVAQEAFATLGKMAAVVAHEVKNPLAGISGVIQVLRTRFEEGSGDHQVMGDVLARIDSLVETIQDLLLFARPRELRLQEVRLSDLLVETARIVENDNRWQGIVVDITTAEVTSNLDVDYFREALLNLFINAAQAMGGRGRIRAEIEVCERHCCIHVIDAGPGIPPQVRERVFEPFFTTKGRGTGLGLSLVRSVVERHDGEVTIDCPARGGTVVTLKLRSSRSGAAE
jgi:two-component system, LuxR family, sensor kinase FixL